MAVLLLILKDYDKGSADDSLGGFNPVVSRLRGGMARQLTAWVGLIRVQVGGGAALMYHVWVQMCDTNGSNQLVGTILMGIRRHDHQQMVLKLIDSAHFCAQATSLFRCRH